MSSRVPAPSELSCADPADPCRLPNAFVADPPFAQVVARTWEGGIRGRRRRLAWNASLFRTANGNDIMFISSGPLTNTGHFENLGGTLRQGIELGASGVMHTVRWGLAYSFLRARFDSPLTLSSPNHPAADDGEIEVASGSRLPGVPQHNLKAHVTASMARFTVGGSLLRTSNQYLRGDEANLLPAIEGFSLANLTADFAVTKQIAVSGRVTNLFGSEHSTFGLLGDAADVLGPGYEDPRFLSPAAPRAAWVGVVFSIR
jgi:iron complex outermembrane recepter protein